MPPSPFKGPLQVVLNLTNRCNMRCLHCFYESGESKSKDKLKRREELSDAEIFELIDEIISLKPFNLCFFGGDPLSHVLFFLQDRAFFGLDILADGSLILSPHVQVKVGNLRKYRIKDYWQAGYQYIWKHPRLQDLLAHAKTYEGIRRIHDYIDDYHFDLIEEPFDENG